MGATRPGKEAVAFPVWQEAFVDGRFREDGMMGGRHKMDIGSRSSRRGDLDCQGGCERAP